MRKDRTGTKNNQDSAIKITYLKFKKKSLTFNKTKIKSSLQKLYFTLLLLYKNWQCWQQKKIAAKNITQWKPKMSAGLMGH